MRYKVLQVSGMVKGKEIGVKLDLTILKSTWNYWTCL